MNRSGFSIIAAALTACGGPLMAAAPPNGGTIAIAPKLLDGAQAAASPAFVTAVREALSQRGFTILDDADHAAYSAELVLSRTDSGTGTTKARAERGAVMPGGAPGAAGASFALPLGTGKSTLAPLQRTRMELRIRKRGEQGLVWDGAAATVRAAGTRDGTDERIAADLSNALLRSYPAAPEGDVGVP